jgi:hypothetical protein
MSQTARLKVLSLQAAGTSQEEQQLGTGLPGRVA